MLVEKKRFILLLAAFIVITVVGSQKLFATDNVKLYTPFTKISVSPGESINYSIDVINDSKEIQSEEISVIGIPKGWTYNLKSGVWKIGQLAILPGEKKSFSLDVNVPYQVNKGSYRFKVMAGDSVSLPLVVVVSAQGSFETEFTTDQPNMQGSSTSTFTYKATLKNRTADKQLYALLADASRGWNITFKADYKDVTSVELEANSAKDITIEIKPPYEIEAGTFKIPIKAATNTTSSDLQLEAVITGTYSMELATPTGLLSANITAGDEKKIDLVVRNTGSSELKDIKLSASKPSNWEVSFDPKEVSKLSPGAEAQVSATIKADKKAIPGDYVTNMEAKTPETSSKAAFRISVKTPMLWGWIGVFIILIAIGSVYYLFHKYGRR